MIKPVRLASEALEKVWGSPHTEPWFQNSSKQNIGEIWFQASDRLPLLVKLLFTEDNLSVQDHPDDTYARAHHQLRGKTEMWHVLRAEPGAGVWLGLKDPMISRVELNTACISGEVVDLLNWYPANAGDTFFVPAGTIHAIGTGLVICEIQQLSDVTYRLYDWGRQPVRELHLEDGLHVARFESHPGSIARRDLGNSRQLLAECPYFRTERLEVRGTVSCPSPAGNIIYIAVEGGGSIAGAPFRQGEAWEIGAGAEPFEICSPAAVFLTTTESV